VSLDDVFHEGEQLAQRLAHEESAARHNGRAVSDTIVRGAIPFFAAQRMAVVASADPDGQPRASIVFGEPGFLRATEESLELDTTRAALDPDLRANAREGADVGVLVIELATRRRFRINGPVASVRDGRLTITVKEAFPNCPQYIRGRTLAVGARTAPTPPREGRALDAAARALIERSDTFFIASRHPKRGLDASHRGGDPGFVAVDGDRLLVPDYVGNGMLMTFGNLLVDPRVGLAFPDFETGRVLSLVGRGEVLFDQPDERGVTNGTGRFLSVRVEGWKEHAAGFEVSWARVTAKLPRSG
jgi:predicted pyridoxine 5'-phosphate oxidase superfamily flavin-nucleotide-binding protein